MMIGPYEVLETEESIILTSKDEFLWCRKSNGKGKLCVTPAAQFASSVGDIHCHGHIYGVIGKITPPGESRPHLLVISQRSQVGTLTRVGDVYKVERVSSIPLTPNEFLDTSELLLDPCPKHHPCLAGDKRRAGNFKSFLDAPSQSALQFTIGAVKTATSTLRSATNQAALSVTSQMKPIEQGGREKEKITRRAWEELLKLLSEPDSLYYACNGLLSMNLLSQWESSKIEKGTLPFSWKGNENFFWNKYLAKDFLEAEDQDVSRWIIPLIMGYVEIQRLPLTQFGLFAPAAMSKLPDHISLALVSRRSRYRCGTRYRSRGVDESGHVSNYVETEQILTFGHHCLSLLQVRGSVPVFWSQPGYKYRPPPQLDKVSYPLLEHISTAMSNVGEEETQEAFRLHFERELALHRKVSIISLIEQTGRESIMADAFLKHILLFDHPDINYITFDFHELCRGLNFSSVSLLIEAVSDIMKEQGFTWIDRHGLVCAQNGIFRVNCMDCLDRTNVVQAAIAKTVLEWQLGKLGLLPPGGMLSTECQYLLQHMWANNGDSISRQYAGTNALKGDYTRTGERKIAGLMKDGMNSASRYYLSQFRDAYRQAAFDIIQGKPVLPDASVEKLSEEEPSSVIDRVRNLLADCQKQLLTDPMTVVGSWGLINADPVTGDMTEQDVDCILILTRNSYFVIMYEENADCIEEFECVPLEDIISIELGPLKPVGTSNFLRVRKTREPLLRINYLHLGEPGYFHQFRSSYLRFFNNTTVVIQSQEEKFGEFALISGMKGGCIFSGAAN
ncbi:unnamed protein product [Darwinula stevensoni]|uniref:Phosphatidylinositide phosphatase SAC2 n=1 Tax=Darwinula stevensoni TaxID=69355 RepID=A0A7R8X5E2_9CRUS|nr:unnamed protein product [Darwinula stevensoni]CAG0884671.1 unnamed protein product [Darwinula stevensoni]